MTSVPAEGAGEAAVVGLGGVLDVAAVLGADEKVGLSDVVDVGVELGVDDDVALVVEVPHATTPPHNISVTLTIRDR